jgi:hypothetical protein
VRVFGSSALSLFLSNSDWDLILEGTMKRSMLWEQTQQILRNSAKCSKLFIVNSEVPHLTFTWDNKMDFDLLIASLSTEENELDTEVIEDLKGLLLPTTSFPLSAPNSRSTWKY